MKTKFHGIRLGMWFTRPDGTHCKRTDLIPAKNAIDLDDEQSYDVPPDEVVNILARPWGIAPLRPKIEAIDAAIAQTHRLQESQLSFGNETDRDRAWDILNQVAIADCEMVKEAYVHIGIKSTSLARGQVILLLDQNRVHYHLHISRDEKSSL